MAEPAYPETSKFNSLLNRIFSSNYHKHHNQQHMYSGAPLSLSTPFRKGSTLFFFINTFAISAYALYATSQFVLGKKNL